MNSARRIFLIAGIYGLLVVVPPYFMETRIGRDDRLDATPPAITHPENYYGFLGVTLAWQLAYLVIASDPLRYRPLMLVAVFAKWSFVAAVAVLCWQGRVAGPVLGFAMIDLVLGFLFLLAFRRLGQLA
jgi:hypothetical protein